MTDLANGIDKLPELVDLLTAERDALREQRDALADALRRVNALLFMRTNEKDTIAMDEINAARAALAKVTP